MDKWVGGDKQIDRQTDTSLKDSSVSGSFETKLSGTMAEYVEDEPGNIPINTLSYQTPNSLFLLLQTFTQDGFC